jgi:hypothetical protein
MRVTISGKTTLITNFVTYAINFQDVSIVQGERGKEPVSE